MSYSSELGSSQLAHDLHRPAVPQPVELTHGRRWLVVASLVCVYLLAGCERGGQGDRHDQRSQTGGGGSSRLESQQASLRPATHGVTAGDEPARRSGNSTPPSADDPVHAKVVTFCANCHAYPPPESFPRAAWHEEVTQGYVFYRATGRTDLVEPPQIEVLQYYRQRAPEKLSVAPAEPAWLTPAMPHFTRQEILVTASVPPAVSSLLAYKTAEPSGLALVGTDMRRGAVFTVTFAHRQPTLNHLADVPHPARAIPGDLDRNGQPDFLVADMGSFHPEDHDRGQALWIPSDQPGSQASSQPYSALLRGVGRVTDLQPILCEGSATRSLIVAEFGWLTTGGLHLLQPDAGNPAAGAWQARRIDPRHGTIHVAPHDLDGDGREDFVALISQEHEVVEAFLQQRPGEFTPVRLFSADDPAFGVSGIELVDFDRDGDVDILLSCGDTLDSYYLKPHHGVFLLENEGRFPFTPHRLLRLPGTMRAKAGDVDGDGDMDVVAAAYLPTHLLRNTDLVRPATLTWLEQTAPHTFRHHVIEQRDGGGSMCLEVGDFDQDGNLDIATGCFEVENAPSLPSIIIWWGNPRARAHN